MRAVGLRSLTNHLSEYVRLAASGETVLVTDRERVVAELVPPREGRAETPQDALLAEAVRKGWLNTRRRVTGWATAETPGRQTGRGARRAGS